MARRVRTGVANTPFSYANILRNRGISVSMGGATITPTVVHGKFRDHRTGAIISGGAFGATMRIRPELNRFLEYASTQFGDDLQRTTKEVHDNLLENHAARVLNNYQRARQANRRPSSRTGRLEQELQRAGSSHTKLMRHSQTGFVIDWTYLDHVVTNPNDGWPYWRSVEFGYRPHMVEAGMFIGVNGRFYPATRARDKLDARVMRREAPAFRGRGANRRDVRKDPWSTRGSEFQISFEGYDFIGREIRHMASSQWLQGYSAELQTRLREDANMANVMQYARFFLGGGGFNAAGRPFDRSTGRLVRGSDFGL